MNKLATVYANSLFEIAQEEKLDKEILEEVLVVEEIIDQNPSFIKVLDAPMIENSEKEPIINDVFQGKINGYLLNFIKVMTDRKAAGYLQQAMQAYEQIYNKHYNIEKVVAITAIAMVPQLQEKLKAKLEAVTGKTILLENKVDPATLGGVVQIGRAHV